MKRKITLVLAFLLTMIFVTGCAALKVEPTTSRETASQETAPQATVSQKQWQQSDDALNYQELHLNSTTKSNPKDLLVVVIDAQKFSFEIYQNISPEKAKTIKEIHAETRAALTFNGGFFTEEFKPTGLLLSNGQKLHKVSKAKLLEGIFAITKNGQAMLLDQNTAIEENTYSFAIQNGPVILDDKGQIKIERETNEIASRTAIGLNKDNHVVIIILKQTLLNSDNKISLYEFAHLLKEAPELKKMGLHSVLNLDGGPSTGMIIDKRYYPEMERVQNVILVKKK